MLVASLGAGLGPSLSACGESALLDLTVVVPPGTDPLANIDSVLLTVSEPFVQVSAAVANPAKLSIGAEIDVEGAVGYIRLEGFGADQRLARGQTPPLILVPHDASMSLLVSEAGAMATLAPQLKQSGAGMMSLVLPGRGVLLAGGNDSVSGPVKAASLYDFVDHQLVELDAMPETRYGANALSCGDACGLIVFGRRDDASLADRWQRFDGDAWQTGDFGSASGLARSEAGEIRLPDGRYVVVGGVDSNGDARGDILLVEVGSESVAPTISAAPVETTPCVAPALAVNSKGAVMIVGGAAAGQGQVALYDSSARTLVQVELSDIGPVSGAAVVALADESFVILGGRDGSGMALRSAWLIDGAGQEKQRYGEALAEGRFGHWAGMLAGELVVIGGSDGTGAALNTEVLNPTTLDRLYLATAATYRVWPKVAPLSSSSLLVAGGVDAVGGAIGGLEVFQPR